MKRVDGRFWLLAGALLLPVPARVEAAAPVLVQSSAGRFEFATIDPAVGHAVAAMAEEMWRHLERPLGLPAGFSSPVFVRLLPPTGGGRAAAFEVNIEPGGVVSVWWRGSLGESALLRRALVRGVLARLVVAQRGAGAPAAPAPWLEHACVAWWRGRADGAQIDLARLQAAGMRPPPLGSLLDWPAEVEPGPPFAAAMLWLLTFLQAESGAVGEWKALLGRLLAGMDPQAALAAAYPGRFEGESSRELWWQTGWHHHRRVRVLPGLEAAESRRILEVMTRFVYAAAEEESDRVVPLPEIVARGLEPVVGAELARRLEATAPLLSSLHPFYLNAGLSLTEAFRAALTGVTEPRGGVATFEADFRLGVELEEASRRALDALEAAAAQRRG